MSAETYGGRSLYHFVMADTKPFIAVLNGPNLNLIGRREPDIYGTRPLNDYLESVNFGGAEKVLFQSNHEGELIDCLHRFGYDPDCVGIVFNPGAFAHYSHAIADAVRSIETPVVEVHISNIHAREEFRHKSVTAGASVGIISGLGLEGYQLAVDWLVRRYWKL